MASIAYVSDEKMLDYHRVNGSQEIVFWRTSTKKFSSFQKGDLLFFLSKDADTFRNREKGIVGYGVFVEEKQMTVERLWKKYSEMTGYNHMEDLIAAIKKTSKTDKMPEKISCLFLKRVIFFLGPIYLSELGIQLPANLESYTYLDAHEGHVTLELLQKVKEIGIDYWSATLNNKVIDTEEFNNEIMRYQIASVYEGMNITTIHSSQKLQKQCFNLFRDLNPEWVNQDQNSFVIFEKDKIKLYYVYSSTRRDSKANYIKLLGQLVYIRNCLKQTLNTEVVITVLSNTEFTDLQKETLYDSKIAIEYILS